MELNKLEDEERSQSNIEKYILLTTNEQLNTKEASNNKEANNIINTKSIREALEMLKADKNKIENLGDIKDIDKNNLISKETISTANYYKSYMISNIMNNNIVFDVFLTCTFPWQYKKEPPYKNEEIIKILISTREKLIKKLKENNYIFFLIILEMRKTHYVEILQAAEFPIKDFKHAHYNILLKHGDSKFNEKEEQIKILNIWTGILIEEKALSPQQVQETKKNLNDNLAEKKLIEYEFPNDFFGFAQLGKYNVPKDLEDFDIRFAKLELIQPNILNIQYLWLSNRATARQVNEAIEAATSFYKNMLASTPFNNDQYSDTIKTYNNLIVLKEKLPNCQSQLPFFYNDESSADPAFDNVINGIKQLQNNWNYQNPLIGWKKDLSEIYQVNENLVATRNIQNIHKVNINKGGIPDAIPKANQQILDFDANGKEIAKENKQIELIPNKKVQQFNEYYKEDKKVESPEYKKLTNKNIMMIEDE